MEDFGNMMSEDEVAALLAANDENPDDSDENTSQEEDNDEQEEVTEENLTLESVGDENNNDEAQEGTDSDEQGSSPSFYSSIANALKEDGVFTDLEDEDLNSIDSPEKFKELIEKQISSGIEDVYLRVNNALNVGMEPNDIKQYESTLRYLDGITESALTDEGDSGEKLRKNLIYQDFINRGYSADRAKKEVAKSFNAGTDIEDAKDALESNKEFFKTSYDDAVEEARKDKEDSEKSKLDFEKALHQSILDSDDVCGDIKLDKSTKQKVYDNITKLVYKNSSGERFTELQKYEMENKVDFLKNVSLFYTLTDGFKNIDKIVNSKVRKELNKGIKNLENVINNTQRNSDGNLKFVSGVDSDSYIGKNLILA